MIEVGSIMKRILVKAIALATIALCGTASQAGDSLRINNLNNISQSDFHSIANDLTATLGFKPLTPTTTLGPLGFDIGAAVSSTTLSNKAAFQHATTSGDSPYSSVPVGMLRVEKGLLFGIDVGAEYGKVPNSNVTVSGASIRYALLDGNIALPTIGIRASYTQMAGVDQMKFSTSGADISISKGFLMATPYAGIGVIRGIASAQNIPTLEDEKVSHRHLFAGVDVNLGLINFDVEADQEGNTNSLSAKVGFRF